jgi:hypothetical protein
MDKSIVFRFQSDISWLNQHRVDSSITLILAIGFTVVTYLSAQKIPPPILTKFYAQDVSFGSDIPTVLGKKTRSQVYI